MPRGVYKRKSVSERFLSRVNKHGVKVSYMKTRCWEFTGSLDGGGYGRFGIKYESWKAHRISWVFANRKRVPKGMFICHKCDNRACVRPSHLFLGTQKENIQDAIKKGRFIPPVMLSGEDHPAAKLSNEDVKRIREFRAQGYTQQLIAEEYDVSQMQISNIINFKSRKGVS